MNEAFTPTLQDAIHLAHIFPRRPLDYCFKKATSSGCTLNVVSIDGQQRCEPHDEREETRINVHVVDGVVTRAWVG